MKYRHSSKDRKKNADENTGQSTVDRSTRQSRIPPPTQLFANKKKISSSLFSVNYPVNLFWFQRPFF
jgi:hypothetical protein